VIEKLKEVESGVASEYLNPVAQLEDNRQIRITVAGRSSTITFSICLTSYLAADFSKLNLGSLIFANVFIYLVSLRSWGQRSQHF